MLVLPVFHGFYRYTSVIISIFKINTFPEQFGMKNQENTYDLKKIQLLDH